MSQIHSTIVLSDLHLGRDTSYLYSKDERFMRNLNNSVEKEA
jgi:hypothetical protein